MSAHLYTSIHGQLIKISSFPGKNDLHPLQNGTTAAAGEKFYSHKTNETILTTKPTVLAESFQFSARSGKFEPHGDKVVLTLDGSDIQLVALSRIIDDWSGLKVPCVVVEQRGQAMAKQDSKDGLHLSAAGDGAGHPQEYRISVIFLSLRKRKFVVRGSFPLTHSLQSASNFCIQDGPIICWECQGYVYVTQAFNQPNQTRIDVVKLDQCLWKPSNTLKWFGLINGDLVAMGTEQSSEQEHSRGDMSCDWGYKWVVVKLPVQKAGLTNAPIADESAVMPREYSNIVNCIHFHQGNISQSGNSCLENSFLKIMPRSGVILAATNQFQLVETDGGIVRRVCSLPFSDACEIAVAVVTGGEELIAVQSTSGRVCSVWRKSFEVAAEWTGFHAVLVDDFMFSGADQVLLLGDCNDAHHKSFDLTDLGMCNWTTKDFDDRSTSKTSSTCAGNLRSAVQALETQKQTGMAALRSSESQCDLKAQLIKQSQDALYKMAERLPSLESPSTSLVCFCDPSGEDGFIKTGEENASMAQDPTLRCLRGWQRAAVDHWIVSVEVNNQTGRSLFDVCISLIPASTAQINLHSAISTCNFKSVVSSAATKFKSSRHSPGAEGESAQGEPMVKKSRLDKNRHGKMAILEPGETMTVIGVTGIPEFVSQPVAKCRVLLNWKELLLGNLDEFVERWCTCGTVVLHASDVVTGKLGINPLDLTKSECEQDIQALDAIQIATSLLLTSKYSNLRCVNGFLKGPMGFQSLAVHDGMMSPSGALEMTRVQIAPQDEPCRMEMIVYSRNQSDLLLFCQCLYQQLPDDVIIKPLPPINQIRSAMATTLTAIDKELQHTSSHLQQLLVNQSVSMVRGHDGQGTAIDGASAGPSNVDKLAKVRGDFEEERSRWRGSDTSVEVSHFNEANNLRREMSDLRLDTDAEVHTLTTLLTVKN